MTVLLRVKRAVAVIRMTAPKAAVRHAPAAAGRYAAALARQLRRVLALTPWDRSLNAIAPDGSFSPQVAARVFSMAYGPLPGITLPRGRLGVPPDRTVAMMMVARVWSRLSAAQRRAIDNRLQAPHTGSAAQAVTAAKATLTPDPMAQTLADGYAATYRGKVPGLPAFRIKVFDVNDKIIDGDGDEDYADAVPIHEDSGWGPGTPAYYRIRVGTLGTAERGGPAFKLIMAHETFHCAEFALTSRWDKIGDWIMEGQADWAATEVNPGIADALPDSYEEYLTEVNSSLLGRSYDAMGFWHRLDEVDGVGSLWSKVPAILQAPDDASAFVAAGAAESRFLERWPSGAARVAGAGPAWNQARPYPLSTAAAPSPMTEIAGDAAFVAYPYEVNLGEVVPNPDEPLIELKPTDGKLRAAASGQDLGVIDGDQWVCTTGDCTCPAGTDGDIPPHKSLAGPVSLAETGGNELGAATVTYHSLEEFCKPGEKGGGGGGGPKPSGGGIQVRSHEGDAGEVPVIGTITSGSCSFTGDAFELHGTGGGFNMELRIAGAKEPGTYPIPYGSSGTYVSVKGSDLHSSLYSPPNEPSPAFAIIRPIVVKKHTYYRVSVGFDPLWNASLGSEYALTPAPGGLVC